MNQDKMNALSYIIAFYNSKNTIGQILDSVIKNDRVLEIILVDDCSEDNPRDVIDKYLENYIRQSKGNRLRLE